MDYLLGAIIAAAVIFVVVKLVRDKKKGKSCCGGDCSNCSGCNKEIK